MRGALILSLSLAFGCTSEGPVNPAPRPGGESTTSTAKPPGSSKPVRRTVETRNPMGEPPGNLLVDGDFELSISFEGSGEQLPWIVFIPNQGQGYLRGETGGLCKSGLRCGVMEEGNWLFGQGTAANGTGMTSAVWIKPPAGRGCDVATVELIHCAFTGFSTALSPVSAEPGEDGWCEHRGTIGLQTTAVCMLITSELAPGETALVDAATLLPADGTSAMSSMKPMSSSRRSEVARMSDYLRKRRPFGDPPRAEPALGVR